MSTGFEGRSGEAEVLTNEERAAQAAEFLRQYGKQRGDSFDIGGSQEASSPTDLISTFLSNPKALANQLNLSSSQAENIRSLLVGGGTGGIYKLLSKHLGDEIAGGIGGLISGWIAGKIMGGR